MALLTLTIVAVTVYISWQGFKNPGIMERCVFSTERIFREKEYSRLLTSGFVHADWLHLFFNMFSLFVFGEAIEKSGGAGWFLLGVIYFSSILGGSLLALYLHRHYEYRALGASGGVCGVIFAAIFLHPGMSIYLFPLPIPIPASIYAILFIAGSFWAMRRQVGNIGHDSHLGGAIVGLAVTTLFHPGIIVASPGLYALIMGGSIAILIYLYKKPLYLSGEKPARSQRKVTDAQNFEALQKRMRLTKSAEEKERQEEELLNKILDKINSSGMESLTSREKKQLQDISNRRRNKENS